MLLNIRTLILMVIISTNVFANPNAQGRSHYYDASEITLRHTPTLYRPANLLELDGKDSRYVQKRTEIWAAIGQVEYIPENQRDLPKGKPRIAHLGTATMISPCFFLTVKHAGISEDDDETYNDGKSHNLKLKIGVGNRGVFKYSVNSHPVVVSPHTDIAIYKVDNGEFCPGADPDVGWINISYSPLQHNTKVSVAGFPGDKDMSMLWRQDNCLLREPQGTENLQWLSDCTSAHGDSGMPAIVFDNNGRGSIVAIAKGAVIGKVHAIFKYDPDYATTFIPLPLTLKDIENSLSIDVKGSLEYDILINNNIDKLNHNPIAQKIMRQINI